MRTGEYLAHLLLQPVGTLQAIHQRALYLGQMHMNVTLKQALGQLTEHVQTGAIDMVDR